MGAISLASAVSQELPTEWNIYMTLPNLHREFRGAFIRDERTGLLYHKFSSASEVNKPTLLVLDELKNEPEPEEWRPYIDNPHTKFLLLAHPGKKHLAAWKNLFTVGQDEERLREYELTP